MSGKINILIADDTKSLLDALKRSLQANKEVLCTTASDGKEAWEILSKTSPETPFDVLVTDLDMPRMSGKELIEMARKKHPDLIVVVISGRMDAQVTENELLPYNINGFLSKPFSLRELSAMIQELTKPVNA
ncbi:hypothetical protein COB55_01790 [Candidatus Wolfebacteria bacterium]|nr:MAG: hypothetical protein COB55_01790 [Candidatus Wolfebacteria bacterium]